MAHLITQRSNGFAEMAFAGATPWHGLGQQLPVGASIEEWQKAAGLDWSIMRTPVQFSSMKDEVQQIHTWPETHVLYRSDTNAALSTVSPRYHVVQPKECLEFFRDLVSDAGFEIETAGTLKGGRRIWALANTGFSGDVVPGDNVKSYLLLATSCDGALATTAQFTSVRVVCNNTLSMSLSEADASSQVKVRHNTMFDPRAAKRELGLNAKDVYQEFMGKMQSFSNKSLSYTQAEEVIERLFAVKAMKGPIRESKGFKTVLSLFNGAGIGASIDGVAGTGWGLINSVTEYIDHHARAGSTDNRLSSAWFGVGADIKKSIVELVNEY